MPEVVFGGMPAWLIEAYLIELGGKRGEDGTIVRGDGWRATLTTTLATPPAIARVAVKIEGERAPDVLAALRKKARRGGG